MKDNTLAWRMWDFVQYFLNLSFQYIFIGFQDPMTVYTRNFNWGKIGAHGEKTIAIKKKTLNDKFKMCLDSCSICLKLLKVEFPIVLQCS